jgi:uncharacterized protein (TIGR03083 family)
MGPLGHRYLEFHDRFVSVVTDLGPSDLARAVPACPGWTVREVIAHLAGVCDDALNGRMAGAPGDEWTAAQIQRAEGATAADLLTRWQEQAPVFAEFLDPLGEGRPPIDVFTHELDVRGALGRPVAPDDPAVEALAVQLAEGIDSPVRLEVHLGDRVVHAATGAPGPPLVLRTTAHEVCRSRMGRRSEGQVRGYDWSGDPSTVLDSWFVFGPAFADVVE